MYGGVSFQPMLMVAGHQNPFGIGQPTADNNKKTFVIYYHVVDNQRYTPQKKGVVHVAIRNVKLFQKTTFHITTYVKRLKT